MNRARVALIACAALVLFAVAGFAAPATHAEPTTPAAPTSDAAFLASLATSASVTPAISGVGVPAPTPMACPTGFCAAARRECTADCAPCLGVTTCIISICDYTCGCQC